MATATGRGDKVAFLKDLLGRRPEVNHKDAGRAWQEAGHEGTISGTSFYRVKSDLGLSGKGQSGGGYAAGKSAPKKAKKASPKGKKTGSPAARSQQPRPLDNGQAMVDEPTAQAEATGFGDRERVLDQADAHIDDLFFLLKTQGGLPEAEARLREVRRILYRGLEG